MTTLYLHCSTLLQWGRALMNTEVDQGTVDSAVDNGLQWGRALMNTEVDVSGNDGTHGLLASSGGVVDPAQRLEDGSLMKVES
jgi:hypothetical protein